VNACRDPKDNFLLALAKDGRADLLITGDKELLDLAVFEGTRIVSPSSFLKAFKAT
jgi:predicted nucleic acid-binding protein